MQHLMWLQGDPIACWNDKKKSWASERKLAWWSPQKPKFQFLTQIRPTVHLFMLWKWGKGALEHPDGNLSKISTAVKMCNSRHVLFWLCSLPITASDYRACVLWLFPILSIAVSLLSISDQKASVRCTSDVAQFCSYSYIYIYFCFGSIWRTRSCLYNSVLL